MDDFIKVSAKTVDDAIIEASIQLGTSSDNVEYEVLESGSSGFLGFGSKPAVIHARKKAEFSSDLKEDEIEIKEVKEIIKETIHEKPLNVKHKEKKKEYEKKIELVKEPENEKKEAKKAPLTDQDREDFIKKSVDFLKRTCNAMKLKVEVSASFDKEDNLCVDVSGEDMGLLIGKRGQTLDSLQYLTSLVVNKGNFSYIRVKLDTENYRSRRRETLENLARNIASKVKRTRKPVHLEPMNPYERRIIHSTLQSDPGVSTHSEGEEPYRKVVVTLKK